VVATGTTLIVAMIMKYHTTIVLSHADLALIFFYLISISFNFDEIAEEFSSTEKHFMAIDQIY